jgi:hypothetical protein
MNASARFVGLGAAGGIICHVLKHLPPVAVSTLLIGRRTAVSDCLRQPPSPSQLAKISYFFRRRPARERGGRCQWRLGLQGGGRRFQSRRPGWSPGFEDRRRASVATRLTAALPCVNDHVRVQLIVEGNVPQFAPLFPSCRRRSAWSLEQRRHSCLRPWHAPQPPSHASIPGGGDTWVGGKH